MTRRFFVTGSLLLLAALTALGVYADRLIDARVEQDTEILLASQTEMFRDLAAGRKEPGGMETLLRSLGERTGTRFTLIAANGRVIADSHADPDRMENHNTRFEVAQARRDGKGLDRRFSATVGYDMLYLAVPLGPGRSAGPVIRCAYPLTRIREESRVLWRTITMGLLVILLTGAGITYLAAQRLARPLDRIRDGALAMSRGELGTIVPTDGPAELVPVAESLNHLGRELSARIADLAAQRSRLEAVLASMEEGVVTLDSAGRVLGLNDAARAILQLPSDSTGRPFPDVAGTPDLAADLERVRLEGGTARRQMIAGSRSILLSITAAGKDGGMVVFARDVTEDRRYDTLRREFVANVSHELRTPLSLAQGYVETLIDGACRDPEKAPEFLGMVDRNLKRLGAIVADLLQLSRLEDTATSPRIDRFDEKEFLSRIQTQFLPLAGRKRQKLGLTIDEPLGTLEADPELLERAVVNLVDNAIKYTQEGGTITIHGATGAGEQTISVRDDGPGIPEAAQPRIFERFYRVDKSRSRELGGTGLGLAIVKHIAQLHGGSITVDSSPGRGSVFTLRLPLKKNEG